MPNHDVEITLDRERADGPFSHPPMLPGRSRLHRIADRFLRGVYALGNLGLLTILLGGFFVASVLPDHVGVWLAAALYLAAGLYCSVNFWRCREAHCVVTGIGFTALGVGLLGAGAGVPNLISEHNGLILLGTLVLAVGFEAVWRAVHGSNAVRREREPAAHC